MNSKNLHKHSLPILSLAIASVLALGAAAISAKNSGFTTSSFATSLTHRVVTVKSTSAVTAQVKLNPADSESSLPDMQAINQVVLLDLAVQNRP